jgi:hypothetical protein
MFILQIINMPLMDGDSAWSDLPIEDKEDVEMLQDAQPQHEDELGGSMVGNRTFLQASTKADNPRNKEVKGKAILEDKTTADTNLDISGSGGIKKSLLDTWEMTSTAKPPHTDYPINSKEMELLMNNDDFHELAKLIFDDPEYWALPTWEQNKFSMGRATHEGVRKHWKARIALFQPERIASRNRNSVSPPFVRLLIGEFVLKWQIDYNEIGKEGPIHPNVWTIWNARKGKRGLSEEAKVSLKKKVKREKTRSTPQKPKIDIDYIMGTGGGASFEHFNAEMPKPSVHLLPQGSTRGKPSLFDSSPATPTSHGLSQSTRIEAMLPPPKDLAEVRSRLNRLGGEVKEFAEEKLINTYNLIGIYDYTEVEALRKEVKQLQENCAALVKEKHMRGGNYQSDYEEKPRANLYKRFESDSTTQATVAHQAQVEKLRGRIEKLMDEEDALKEELKEAKLDTAEKCKALEKMEGLVKAKDKEIMELKAIKPTSLLSKKDHVGTASHQKTITIVDVTADKNPLWPEDAEEDDNKGWTHINNFDVKQKGVPEHVSSGQYCSWCLNPFGPESAAMLGACGHVFHHSCLEDWCSTRTKCWCNTPIHDREFVQRGLDRAMIETMESQFDSQALDSEAFAWSEPQPLELEALPSNPWMLNSQQFETLLHHGQYAAYLHQCRVQAPTRIQQNQARDERAKGRRERLQQLERRQQALDEIINKRST